jgi:membrane protein DedA with SNARE-associated domain
VSRHAALRLLASGGTGAGLGAPASLGLLLPMEAGIPIPIPADLVMLVIGERAAAGNFPLWAAVLALEVIAVVGSTALFLIARGPGHALVERLGARLGLTPERLGRASDAVERRGRSALVVGRATPGLRTVTVVAAGASGISARRAIPALAVGASVFLQLHLVLGYALGPAARDVFDRAKGPAILAFVALLAAAAAFWVARRGRRAGTRAFTEAACPLCLALGRLSEQAAFERVVAIDAAPSRGGGI